MSTQPAPSLPPAYRRALELVALQRRQAAEADEAVAALRATLATLFRGAEELDTLLGQLARGAGTQALAYEPQPQVESALRVHVAGATTTPVQACTTPRLDSLEARVAVAAGLLVHDAA